jgi:hypothetical protein
MVPGLAQTPAYATELLLGPGRPSVFDMTDSEIESLVSERVRRQ